MKLRLSAVVLLALTLVFGGCASKPQLPINASADLLNAKTTKIAVVMTTLPKVDTQFPGAGCLLCMAAASMTNSTLTSYVQTLPADEVAQIPVEMTKILRARGLDAVAITTPLDLKTLPDASKVEPNFARKDFSALKAKYQVDKVLVLEIQALGVWRNYANYIPAGAPQAVFRASGYIVNLTNNSLEWYAPVNVVKPTDGQWDEPPKFPGLTNAYFQALETGRETLTKPFAQ